MSTPSAVPEYDPNAPIEAQVLDDGNESGYGDSLNTSATQSVTSSVKDYVYDNGRRYHRYGGEGKYSLPNDETEQDRLDLYHHMTLQILGGRLHVAPLPDQVDRVLDCGTGTGIWALDFGEIHPEAQVVGVDLSPIQPTWVYPNVKFEVDNLEEDWTWPVNHFSFIHSRMIFEGIRDYEKFIRQMYTHTAPGGYVEISEVLHDGTCDDNTYTPDTFMWKYMDAYKKSATAAGMKIEDISQKTVDALKAAGFVDVELHQYVVPWGPWPKDKRLRRIGATMAGCMESGLEAYGLSLFTKFGGFTVEDAKALMVGAMKDTMGGKVHAYYLQYQIVGRKPVAEE